MLPDFVWAILCAVPPLAFTVLGFSLWCIVRRRRGFDGGGPHCEKCWYRLRGLPRNVCPECGREFAWPDTPRRGGDARP